MSEQRAAVWEGMGAAALADRWGCPAVNLFASLDSTSDTARRLAREGAAEGTVVLADEQVAGRGRMGRAWTSAAGLGLWFTIVAPPGDPRGAGALPLRVGLAVALALEPFVAPGLPGIKWPNDLVADGRKMGGILCESTWDGARPGRVLAGIGINVLHAQDDFPPEFGQVATSLRMGGGAGPARLPVADAVIPSVLAALGVAGAGAGRGDFEFGSGPALTLSETDALARRDVLRGRPVTVTDTMSGTFVARGTASGIRSDGALMIIDDHGAEVPIFAGTVRPQHRTDCV